MKYLVFSIIVVGLVVFGLSAVYGQAVEDGLYAYWSFDQANVNGGTIKELEGSSDATIIGNPQIVPGKVGQAIQFNGVDDYIDLTTIGEFGQKLGAFTLEMWLKTAMTPDWTTLFKILNDGCTTALGIDLNRTAKPTWAYLEGNTHFYIRNETCLALASEIQASIYDEQWHHIVWSVENSAQNACKVYVDGAIQDMVLTYEQNPEGFADFQHPVYLGAGNNRGKVERFCPATVDEFRLYARALSDAEVLRNYQSASEASSVDLSQKLPSFWGQIKDK